MKSLEPHETDLTGKLISIGNEIKGDETCMRIDWLISNMLQEVTTDSSGWDILYRDPKDGRLWELTYPKSHIHGGGPPRLTLLSDNEAKVKYKINE